jgi:hypothetical protein
MSRILRVLAIVAAALAAAWSGVWFLVAGTIESRVRAWAEAERAQETRIAFGGLAVDGFPMRWRLVATDYEIAREGPAPHVLGGARFEALIVPWDLAAVPLRLPGPQRLERRAAGSAPGYALRIEAERPDAVLRLSPDGRARALDLDFGGITAALPEIPGPVTASRLRIAVAETDPPATATREFLTLAFGIEDLVLPRDVALPFAPTIRTARLELALRGARATSGTPAERVIAWRDSGGVLELLRLELDWEPLRVDGDGTMALDARNRPQAALALRIAGHQDLLDILVRTRRLPAPQAAIFRGLAAGMARPNPVTGRQEITLPVTAQDGRLSIAGFPVMPLPSIALPTR